VGAVLGTLCLAGLAILARPSVATWWKERALPRGQKPTILLLTLDSTRADHLRCYGRQDVETPNLDSLAREGVLFERAYAQVPLCLPSHATILTGTTPRRHGIRDDGQRALAPQIPTLAEQLRQAGYRSAAFVSSTVLDRRFGLDRGFDVYDDDLGPPGKTPGQGERSVATEAVDRALAWLSSAAPGPIFLWVHLDDAKPPHPGLPEALAKAYADRPYLGEIAFMDGEIGKLLAGLRRSSKTALVAVVADHGESLGEHGEDSHGRFTYAATTRVPLLLSMPGRLRDGLRIRALVRTMDLTPTLLDLAGLSRPSAVEGASLVPLMVGKAREGPGPAPSESLAPQLRYGMKPVYGLRSGPYLLIRGARAELYDSDQDPQERNEASARLPRVVASLARELRSYAPDLPDSSDSATDEEDLYQRYRSGLDLESRGDRKSAIAVYRGILSESPGFVYARRNLSEALLREDRLAESEIVLKEIVERGEAVDVTYLNLALARYRLKKPAEALEWLKQGVLAFPDSAALHHRTGKVLMELKRFDEAARELTQALEIEPRFLDARLSLAQALEALGQTAAAESAYGKVKELAPASEEGQAAAAALGRLSGAGQKKEPRA
jgi:arylsulfatase A-like enzyme